jgi:hypothetical protein
VRFGSLRFEVPSIVHLFALPAALKFSFANVSSWSCRFDPVLAVAVLATWVTVAPRLVPGRSSDRGIFVSVAERLLAGDTLYSGVYDNKEPLFYFFVASQLVLGSWAQVAAEAMAIMIAAGASYAMTVKIASRWTAAAISFIAVPITLTGAFYLPGYTELPGLALVLAAIAASFRERPLLAGLSTGLLIFVKLIFVPIALLGVACFPLARRRFFDGTTVALGVLAPVGLVAGILTARGELMPFIETIKLNIAYSQGSLIGSKRGLAALAEHIRWIGPKGLAGEAALITLAMVLISGGLWGNRERTSTVIAGACVSAFLGSLLVLAITGLWKHHLQILYIPSLLAMAGLAPLLDLTASRARLLTLGLVVMAGYLLAGTPEPGGYLRSFAAFHPSYAELSDLSPEAQRLLRTGDAGAYARFGTNDDQGHAAGLRRWKLACPRFHQYYFEPAPLLNQVFECASTAPTLIISPDFGPTEIPAWDEFVGRVEHLVKENYACDADSGLRICRRHVAPTVSNCPALKPVSGLCAP